MNVTDAVDSRKSVRAFLDKAVPNELILKLLKKASRSPSGEIFNLGESLLSTINQ